MKTHVIVDQSTEALFNRFISAATRAQVDIRDMSTIVQNTGLVLDDIAIQQWRKDAEKKAHDLYVHLTGLISEVDYALRAMPDAKEAK